MVKRQKINTRKKRSSKEFKRNVAKARKINASMSYETCTEQLSPFVGLLAVIKFLDLVKFHDIFHFSYNAPLLKPKLGHYLMVVGQGWRRYEEGPDREGGDPIRQYWTSDR